MAIIMGLTIYNIQLIDYLILKRLERTVLFDKLKYWNKKWLGTIASKFIRQLTSYFKPVLDLSVNQAMLFANQVGYFSPEFK